MTEPKLEEKLDKIIDGHTAGCPVKGIRWTYLGLEEVQQKLLDKGIPVCREVICRLLHQAGLGRRKMAKQQTMKTVEGRNEQFGRIHRFKQYYLSRGYAVLSIDVKKKECLGAFYRPGRVFSSAARPCYDHDFNSFSTGKLVPMGIFDIGQKAGHLYLGNSADTAQFNAECLRRWWNGHGRKIYQGTDPMLILCDGGGSNGSRNNLFKAEIQKLSNETGLRFRIAHYPSYCSKYNPIEHLFFPVVTRAWSGIMLDSAKTAKKLLIDRKAQIKSGLQIAAHIVQRTFVTGKKLDNNFWSNSNISFDNILPKWNYRICPIS